jgi:hypothetical protein
MTTIIGRILALWYIYTTFGAYAHFIAPGIQHEHIFKNIPYPLSLHILTVDPQKAHIMVAPADHYGTGEKTSLLAQKYKAIAAINGGFFRGKQETGFAYAFTKLLEVFGLQQYTAFPAFCLKIKDRWFSFIQGSSGVLGWKQGGQIAYIDTIKTEWKLEIAQRAYPIKVVNAPSGALPILYTPAYGAVTPARTTITELVIEHTTIKEIKRGRGSTPIPKEGYVYAVKHPPHHLLKLKPGMAVSLTRTFISTLSHNWEDMDYLLGSTPLLIKNGTIPERIYKKRDLFYTQPSPRTAVGLLSNGHWLFIVVDGRQGTSRGFTLPELAHYMKDRGCIAALNLDGGSSSTLVIKNTVVNSPSGPEFSLFVGALAESPVANAILIAPFSLS